MVKKIDTILKKITGVFGGISIVLLICVIVLITIDVVARKFFASTVPGAYELTERALMCLVFAGLSYTESGKGHINVTMLINVFGRTAKFLVFGIMNLLGAATAFYLSYAAFVQFGISHKTNTVTTVLLIPLYPFFLFEAICALVLGITILWSAITSFIAIKNDTMAEEIQGAWS